MLTYAQVDANIRLIPPFDIYNGRDAVCADRSRPFTDDTWRRAKATFPILEQSPKLKSKYRHDKLVYWAHWLDAATRAIHCNSCVRVSRDNSAVSEKDIQVLDCIEERGLARSVRSPAGFSSHQSRMVPFAAMRRLVARDPADFVTPATQLVRLFNRKTRRKPRVELPVDMNDPIPADIARRLSVVNEVNNQALIEYASYDPWQQDFTNTRQLRPILVAYFTDNYDQHGRFYTDGSGHMALRKIERRTITFSGMPTVELDYSGIHPKIVYASEGIDYQDDPYAFWPVTTPPQRELTKLVVNVALNARNRRDAIAACKGKADPRDKTGKARDKARALSDALDETGLSFERIYELALQFHQPIAHRFGSDAGIKLMRIDSMIVLNVLDRLAERGIPCLPVHDSCIVEQQHCDELWRVMFDCYRAVVGYGPKIKPSVLLGARAA